MSTDPIAASIVDYNILKCHDWCWLNETHNAHYAEPAQITELSPSYLWIYNKPISLISNLVKTKAVRDRLTMWRPGCIPSRCNSSNGCKSAAMQKCCYFLESFNSHSSAAHITDSVKSLNVKRTVPFFLMSLLSPVCSNANYSVDQSQNQST